MMQGMKYIRFDDGLMDQFLIFPVSVDHSVMAANVNGEIISAGFVGLVDGLDLLCYGESVSLGIPSKKEDTALLSRYLKIS